MTRVHPWKKATWAAGITSALSLAGLVYARYFWGRNEVTQRSADAQEYFARYDQKIWERINSGELAAQNQAPAPLEPPMTIPFRMIYGDPAASQKANGQELPPPPAFRVVIPSGGSIAEVRERAFKAALPALGVSSTSDIDFSHYEIKPAELDDPAGLLELAKYTRQYLAVYPEFILDKRAKLPLSGRLYFAMPARGFFDLRENNLVGTAEKRLFPLWSTTFQQGRHEATALFYFYSGDVTEVLGFKGYLEMGTSLFVQHYSDPIDRAAVIVAQAHSQLHLQNMRALIRLRLMKQLGSMRPEDLWQDRAACKFAGCDRQAFFDSAVKYSDIPVGVPDPIFGKIWNLPAPAWRFLSWTYRGNLDRQGIGPAQNIVGLVRRAGNDPSIVRRYAPFVTAGDFRDSRAIVRAVLDPVKAIYIRAMTLDMILGELERTFLADPRVTFPANQTPFINNPATAREYAFIYLANQLWSFPEEDRYLPALLTGEAPAEFLSYAKLFAIGGLFGIEPEFPGMFVPRVQVNEMTTVFPTYEVVQ